MDSLEVMTGLCAMTLPDLQIYRSPDFIGKFRNPEPLILQFLNSSIPKYNSSGQTPEAEPGAAEGRRCVILAEIFEIAQLEARACARGYESDCPASNVQSNQIAVRIEYVCLRLDVGVHQADAGDQIRPQ